MNSEIWREIPSEPGFYASDHGRIKSPMGRILTPHSMRGYKRITLSNKGRKNKVLVHRLVCEAFHGPQPFEGAIVAHYDDVRDNNNPENLRWANQKENIDDAFRNGRINPKMQSIVVTGLVIKKIYEHIIGFEDCEFSISHSRGRLTVASNGSLTKPNLVLKVPA